MRTLRNVLLAVCGTVCGLAMAADSGAPTKDQVEAAKNAIDLRVYESLQDLLVKQKEAEARKALAEAERAEALAKLPATEIKALSGSVASDKLGAAGLVKAFDLGKELAVTLCERTKDDGPMSIYDGTAIAGVVAAKSLEKELARILKDVATQNRELEKVKAVDVSARIAPLLAIASITAGVKTVADLASLFKNNVTAVGTPFGEGTRNLFITALIESCGSDRIVGLGTGYLGELDTSRSEQMRATLQELLRERRTLSDHATRIKKIADDEKDPKQKNDLNELGAAAGALLKQVDAFVESLKASEVSDKSPMFNAGRYLAYADRIANAKVLDFDLRLEGLAITKENIFTGQSLRLSGVAFLSYRVYAPNGQVQRAETLRRISPPVKVDFGGTTAPDDFWNGGAAAKK